MILTLKILLKRERENIRFILDVLVLPSTGEYELVDEHDLELALKNGQITKKQYHEAYIIAHQLMIEIEDNFAEIHHRIMHCYKKMIGKLNKHKKA